MAATIDASVVLTRPQDKNQLLAQRLDATGLQAICLPALCISDILDPGFVVPPPTRYDLVVFVSGRAVSLYMRALAQASSAVRWPSDTLAAAVGLATAMAVTETGVVPVENVLYPDITQPQDSENLWSLLNTRIDSIDKALIVRGEHGREWLGSRLEEAGVKVDRLAVYRREAAVWNNHQHEQLALALSSARPCVFLLTSSESVDAVFANICRFGLEQAWQRCRFVVIHERIASRLQSLLGASGQGSPSMVKLCQPDDEAIFQAILRAASP
ncbi:uroporphyrinogen-III synthase [Alcaligenaceae bacterium]|nr:uroporphyrinogen-III synthase [Alcaligenaceae bacterium]